MADTTNLLALFTSLPSWAELLVIAFVGLLLFGRRLPDVARSLGQSIVEFKKGMQGFKQDVENAGTKLPDRSSQANSLPDSSKAAPTTQPRQGPTGQANKQAVESHD